MKRDRDARKEGEHRLFFAFEVEMPQGLKLPRGRCLAEKQRHITLAFLGEVDLAALLIHLERFPRPSFSYGFVGEFTDIAFFPASHPRAVVWKTSFHQKERAIREYQLRFCEWLALIGFSPLEPERLWEPHVTLCRSPFDRDQWTAQFQPLPFMASKLHLYESVGNLTYEPRWTYALVPPYEELKGRETLVIRVRGRTLGELMTHLQVSIAQRFPNLWAFFQDAPLPRVIDDVMRHLNKCLSAANAKEECLLKSIDAEAPPIAVDDNTLEWDVKILSRFS